jgi:prepilin-type N-terminal cleavage/methylation domain-containing protein
MKTRFRTKVMNSRGFSLMELLTVMAIMSLLLAIGTIKGKQWMDQYHEESQMRTMHTDLLATRAMAMEKNRQYFMVLSAGSYQIVEDKNDSGGNKPDAAPADTWQPSKTMLFSPKLTSDPLYIAMDARGLVSTYPTAIPLNGGLSIQFDTRNTTPEYDCLQLYATRINIGRMNGTNCNPR